MPLELNRARQLLKSRLDEARARLIGTGIDQIDIDLQQNAHSVPGSGLTRALILVRRRRRRCGWPDAAPAAAAAAETGWWVSAPVP